MLRLLEPTPLTDPGAELSRWRGGVQRSPGDRLFGGLLLAQALVVAGRTALGAQRVISLQADFVGGVPTDDDLVWEVARVSDAASLSTRRSTLRAADGRELFSATTRWALTRADLPSHGALRPRPAGDPESLTDLSERFGADERIPAWWREERPVHFRPFATPPFLAEHVDPAAGGGQSVWIRATVPLPDDHLLRAGLVAYTTDMSIVEDAFRVLGSARHEPGSRILSLTHALAFHDQPDLSRWHQFDARVEAVSHGRALGTGEVFDADGRHLVSVSQLGLVKTAAL
ncbi:acyl-CoA thioesterase [Nocardiopsis ganjiahuensis]|uniref:acyl-CoA thioesterase n=1 Tax=Nocardiopsis ganjiahuensis TaxID=239984 RepID=UPI001EF9DF49|nr:acyl-CoA thioesterase domain-containing protein [Nocardiopsis ganjiahuensis]